MALRLMNSREVIFRVVIVAVILASVIVAWWSFAKVLPPLQKQSKELATTYRQVSAQVDKLAHEWSETKAVEVTNTYVVARSRLFGSAAAFDQWLANLNGQASTLTLDAKADFGKTTPLPVPGEKLATIPATIFLEVRPAAEQQTTTSPYQRLVQLTQQLGGGEKRTDLAELTVAGGTGSVSRAVVVLNLWAGEERGK
jgi:outer membrane murein-binding lipoprotein Lpp